MGRQHAPAPTTTASPFVDALNSLNETFETIHRSFLSVAGVGSDAEFLQKAQGQFDTFQNTIKSGVDQLNEEVFLLWTKIKIIFAIV